MSDCSNSELRKEQVIKGKFCLKSKICVQILKNMYKLGDIEKIH